jgi:hypothetical protein
MDPEWQPLWLNRDSFDDTGPVGPDPQCGVVALEPLSSSQFSLDLSLNGEYYGPSTQGLHSYLGTLYGQPDGMPDVTFPFHMDNTCFSNPLENHIAELDKGMDSSGASNYGTQSAPAQLLGTNRSGAQKMKEFPITSTNILVDSTAAKLCDYWLQLYPNVYPKDTDIHALSQLTGQQPVSIERWLNSKIRSVLSSSHDSGIGSSKSSTASYAISSETSASGQATLAEMIPPQMSLRNLNDGESGMAPVFIEVDSRSRFVFEIPATWTILPFVKDGLAKAAWFSRARTSCRPTSNIADLVRNPDIPLQCTRKCGYATAPKKDWKRHESNAFPQHGFLCTIPAAIRIGNFTFCTRCPAERQQQNPTILHMKSKHGLTFSSDRDMEMRICDQACHRKEHLKTHFSKIHPGIHPDAWVKIGAFDVKESGFPRHCGFCRKAFASWDERIDHIQVHFEHDCLDMRQWQNFDDSDDPYPNKRQWPDDDADDRSDSGDSDQDDDGGFGKGNSGAGKRNSGKKRNRRAQQLRSDRSFQEQLHYHGTSSSNRGSASEDERILSPPNHVYEWLKNISVPEEGSPAQEALGSYAHSPESHLDSHQKMLSYKKSKHKQEETGQKANLVAGRGFDPLSEVVSTVVLAVRFAIVITCIELEMARSTLAFAESDSTLETIQRSLRESPGINSATRTALDSKTPELRRLLAREKTFVSAPLNPTRETFANWCKGTPRTLESFDVLSWPPIGWNLYLSFLSVLHTCKNLLHRDLQFDKGYHSNVKRYFIGLNRLVIWSSPSCFLSRQRFQDATSNLSSPFPINQFYLSKLSQAFSFPLDSETRRSQCPLCELRQQPHMFIDTERNEVHYCATSYKNLLRQYPILMATVLMNQWPFISVSVYRLTIP